MNKSEKVLMQAMLTALGATKKSLRCERSTGHWHIHGKYGHMETANGHYLMHLRYERPRQWGFAKRVLRFPIIYSGDIGGTLQASFPVHPKQAQDMRRWLGVRKGRA